MKANKFKSMLKELKSITEFEIDNEIYDGDAKRISMCEIILKKRLSKIVIESFAKRYGILPRGKGFLVFLNIKTETFNKLRR